MGLVLVPFSITLAPSHEGNRRCPTSAESETGRINLRDVPAPVIQHYKAKAKAQGQSLNAYLVNQLAEAMTGEKSEWQRFLDTHTRGDISQDDGEAAFVALDQVRDSFGQFEDDRI